MPCRQVSTSNGAIGSGQPGGGGYKTEADCLQACKEGACCEGTTCSVKPQCQCQGTGKTFKGVGTTCTPNPCVCCGGCVPTGFSYIQVKFTQLSAVTGGGIGNAINISGTYSIPSTKFLEASDSICVFFGRFTVQSGEYQFDGGTYTRTISFTLTAVLRNEGTHWTFEASIDGRDFPLSLFKPDAGAENLRTGYDINVKSASPVLVTECSTTLSAAQRRDWVDSTIAPRNDFNYWVIRQTTFSPCGSFEWILP